MPSFRARYLTAVDIGYTDLYNAIPQNKREEERVSDIVNIFTERIRRCHGCSTAIVERESFGMIGISNVGVSQAVLADVTEDIMWDMYYNLLEGKLFKD